MFFIFFAVINVPDDYSTIQAGIDASVNGDTVLVAPGLYVENINFSGKSIVVISSDGAEFTTLQSGASGGYTVTIGWGENSNTQFSGFAVLGDINTIVMVIYIFI